ncbi:ubiquinone biosynthesis accessory factor UbiJ [Rhodocyclaceae bacterium SMB388]
MEWTSSGVARVINHLLGRAPWARERLMPYAGSSLCCRISPIELVFHIEADGYLAAGRSEDAARPADVTITVPLAQLPGALVGDADKLMAAVNLQGNAELADSIGFVFRNLEWDAEEDLSRVLGDIPARRLAETARAMRRTHQRALSSLGGNLGEYFAEEQSMLVTHGALHVFTDDVRALRDDLARLEKRVERSRRAKGPERGLPKLR